MLTGGNPRSLGRADEVAALVREGGKPLDELFECLFVADEVVRMRAADALEKVCRTDPERLSPYTERLLGEVATISQPSVRWHLAQMLGELPLSPDQRSRAVEVLRRNLRESNDWIVINMSIESLAGLAREDPELREKLLPLLDDLRGSDRKSIAARARRLHAELEPGD